MFCRLAKNQNTVIIRQLNTGNQHAQVLTHDPIGIALCLSNIIPDNLVRDVRINKRQNIIAVELTKPDEDAIGKLVNIKEIGKCSVRGYRAAEGIDGPHCSGVIGPIGLDTDLEDMKHLLVSPEQVIKISRLPKFHNGIKEESTAIRVDFAGKNLPGKIKLGYLSFEVKEYNPPPLRCYRCCLLYTSPSPRDKRQSRMPSSA